MLLGQKLKEARKQANFTQEELAKLIGVEAAEISHYESNKRRPRLEVFIKLLDVLHLTADEALGREVTVRDESKYEVKLASKDLEILSYIKENPKLYKILLSDTERNVKVINNNLKRILPELDD